MEGRRYGTYESTVERCWKLFEVEPDVERAVGREGDFQAHCFEPLQDVVPLGLEMLLKGNLMVNEMSKTECYLCQGPANLLLLNMPRIKQRDGCQLKAASMRIKKRSTWQ